MTPNQTEEEKLSGILDFAHAVSDVVEQGKLQLPYNFNIIDELHANENAHTRILLKLLSYNKGGVYSYLKSFLSMMNDHNPGVEFPVDRLGSPHIRFNQEYIDGLIEEPSGAYAVIIENKINWAVDQEAQLQRYYDTVKAHGVDAGQIYVIYLTLDGNKEVSSTSLPHALRQQLGNRFIKMNYRNDILPWLEDDLLLQAKEERLVGSGICQYIDHLKGRLNVRDSGKVIRDMTSELIKERLQLDNLSVAERWTVLKKHLDEVQELQNALSHVKSELSDEVYDEWDKIARHYFGGRVSNSISFGGYYQIFCNQPIDINIHFEWEPLRGEMLFTTDQPYYTMNLHVESDGAGVKMGRVMRLHILNDEAVDRGYEILGTRDAALFKRYALPEKKSFSQLSEQERETFFSEAYGDVKELMRIVEEFYPLLEKADECIAELVSDMEEKTKAQWGKYNGWDIALSFNDKTHRIGIEGSFSIRKDRKLVFNSYITVWSKSQWPVYEAELEQKYPQPQYLLDKDRRDDRVYLHLPVVEIGDNLDSWKEKKHQVVDSLYETYRYMSDLTSRVGR